MNMTFKEKSLGLWAVTCIILSIAWIFCDYDKKDFIFYCTTGVTSIYLLVAFGIGFNGDKIMNTKNIATILSSWVGAYIGLFIIHTWIDGNLDAYQCAWAMAGAYVPLIITLGFNGDGK